MDWCEAAVVDKSVCGGSGKKMVARVRKLQIVLWLWFAHLRPKVMSF